MDVERLLQPDEEVSFRVDAAEAGVRLDRALAARVTWASRSEIAAWIRAGRASVGGRPVERASRLLRAGEPVALRARKTPRDLAAPIDDLLGIPLIHRGCDFAVVDKPHGLPSHPGGGVIKRTLLVALALALRGEYQDGGPWLPHRLDRETAGLCVVALSRAAMQRFSRAFASGTIRRFYTARVRGSLAAAPAWLDLRFPLREIGHKPKRIAVDPAGVPAHTRLLALETGERESRVRLEAVTGRQHQLRVHLAHVGHPILGDPLYDPLARAGESLELVADELVIPAGVAGCGAPLRVLRPAPASPEAPAPPADPRR
jgi:23S rRNA pseudouridine1911/1915/1917 synthase